MQVSGQKSQTLPPKGKPGKGQGHPDSSAVLVLSAQAVLQQIAWQSGAIPFEGLCVSQGGGWAPFSERI